MARVAAVALCCKRAAALSSPAGGRLQAQLAVWARAAVAVAPMPFLKDFTRPMCLSEWNRRPSVFGACRLQPRKQPARKFRPAGED